MLLRHVVYQNVHSITYLGQFGLEGFDILRFLPFFLFRALDFLHWQVNTLLIF